MAAFWPRSRSRKRADLSGADGRADGGAGCETRSVDRQACGAPAAKPTFGWSHTGRERARRQRPLPCIGTRKRMDRNPPSSTERGGTGPPLLSSEIGLLGQDQGVFDLDAEVADCTLQLEWPSRSRQARRLSVRSLTSATLVRYRLWVQRGFAFATVRTKLQATPTVRAWPRSSYAQSVP